MTKGIVLVGDHTSHGGVVITGSAIDLVDGRPVARLGDLVDCPERYPGGIPHGVNRIIEGDATTTLGGRPIALHGHHTECGCSLIASGHGAIG